MKKYNTKNFILTLGVLFLISVISCRDDDESPPPVNDFPFTLELKETANLSAPQLETIAGITQATANLALTQEITDFMANFDVWAPKEIVLIDETLSRFVANDFGVFTQQEELDSIPYQATGTMYAFTKPDINIIIDAEGNNEALAVQYRALIKKSTNGGAKIHIPVSFDSFQIAEPNDSIIYIDYDVIYELQE